MVDRLLEPLHSISEGLHARNVLQRAVSIYCHVTGVGLLRVSDDQMLNESLSVVVWSPCIRR